MASRKKKGEADEEAFVPSSEHSDTSDDELLAEAVESATSSDAAEDEAEVEDEEPRPRHAHVRNEDRALLRVDQSPSPVDTVVKGRQLQRFQAAKLKLRTPAKVTNRSAIRTAQDYATAPALRTVTGSVLKSREAIEIKHNAMTKSFTIAGYDRRQCRTLLPHLISVLERLPASPSELSTRDLNWVLNVAKHLAYDAGHHDMQPSFYFPLWQSRANEPSPPRWTFIITGYDENAKKGKRSYQRQVLVSAGTVRKDAAISIPEMYVWRKGNPGRKPKADKGLESDQDSEPTLEDAQSAIQEEVDEEQLKVDEDKALALQMAKHLQITLDGFMGSEEDLLANIRVIKSFYRRSGASVGRVESFGPLNNRPLWQTPSSFKRGGSHLATSSELRKHITGTVPALFLTTQWLPDWAPILKAILDVFMVTEDPLDAWEAGAVAADEVQSLIDTNTPLDPLIRCERPEKDRFNHWHPCYQCCKARQCADFSRDPELETDICLPCVVEMNASQNTSSGTRPGDQRSAGVNAIRARLLRWLRTENKHMGDLASDSQLQEQANIIMKEIDVYKVQGEQASIGVYNDAYVVQTLDVIAPMTKTWYGHRRRVKAPTIDAYRPFFPTEVGGKQVLGYHVPGNIVVTSFSRNIMVKNQPKVLYKAISQIRESETQAEFENALAIHYNVHVNQREANLNANNQGRRIGAPVPEDLETTYRLQESAERGTHIHVPPAKLWRYNDKSDLRNPHLDWQYYDRDYLLQGFEWIAEAAGLHIGADRSQWLRKEPLIDNEEVLFFFAKYAVVRRWTEYELIDWASWKLDRLRKFCDRHFAREYPDHPELRLDCTITEFLFMNMQLFVRLINIWKSRNSQSRWPEKPAGLDDSGIPIMPTINTLLCSSFGHQFHGKEMLTGYSSRPPKRADHFEWRYEDCNVDYESQARNLRRWDFPNECIEEIEAEDANLRAFSSEPIGELQLPPGRITLPPPVLRNELEIDYESDDDTFRMVDETSYDERAALVQNLELEAENARRDALSRSMTSAARQTQEPSKQLAKLAVPSKPFQIPRNMGRMDASCWCSSTVQLLFNTPQLRAVLSRNHIVIARTGRDPGSFDRKGDTTGSKHQALLDHLADLLNEIGAPSQPKMGRAWTANFISVCNQLLGEKAEQWTGNHNRAADEFFTWLLGRLDDALDQSAPPGDALLENVSVEKPGEVDTLVKRVRYHRQQGALAGNFPALLMQDAETEWKAWKQSGHDSPLSDLMAIQFVVEEQCSEPKCAFIQRHFDFAMTLYLNELPADTLQHSLLELGRSLLYEPAQLFAPTSERPTGDYRPTCPKCTTGRLCEKIRRVVREPELLAVQIQRYRMDADAKEDAPLQFGIRNPNRLHLADWSNFEDLFSTVYEPERSIKNLTAEYELIGVLLYIFEYDGKVKHWISYSKIEGTDSWVLCDDTADTPTIVTNSQRFQDCRYRGQYVLMLYKKCKPIPSVHSDDAIPPSEETPPIEMASSPPLPSSPMFFAEEDETAGLGEQEMYDLPPLPYGDDLDELGDTSQPQIPPAAEDQRPSDSVREAIEEAMRSDRGSKSSVRSSSSSESFTSADSVQALEPSNEDQLRDQVRNLSHRLQDCESQLAEATTPYSKSSSPHDLQHANMLIAELKRKVKELEDAPDRPTSDMHLEEEINEMQTRLDMAEKRAETAEGRVKELSHNFIIRRHGSIKPQEAVIEDDFVRTYQHQAVLQTVLEQTIRRVSQLEEEVLGSTVPSDQMEASKRALEEMFRLHSVEASELRERLQAWEQSLLRSQTRLRQGQEVLASKTKNRKQHEVDQEDAFNDLALKQSHEIEKKDAKIKTLIHLLADAKDHSQQLQEELDSAGEQAASSKSSFDIFGDNVTREQVDEVVGDLVSRLATSSASGFRMLDLLNMVLRQLPFANFLEAKHMIVDVLDTRLIDSTSHGVPSQGKGQGRRGHASMPARAGLEDIFVPPADFSEPKTSSTLMQRSAPSTIVKPPILRSTASSHVLPLRSSERPETPMPAPALTDVTLPSREQKKDSLKRSIPRKYDVPPPDNGSPPKYKMPRLMKAPILPRPEQDSSSKSTSPPSKQLSEFSVAPLEESSQSGTVADAPQPKFRLIQPKETPSGVFRCPYPLLGCDWKTNKLEQVVLHAQDHCTNAIKPCPYRDVYECQRYLKLDEVDQHVNEHRQYAYECPRIFDLGCHQRFNSIESASEHVRTHHAALPDWLQEALHDAEAATTRARALADDEYDWIACEQCLVEFPTEWQLTIHIVRAHFRVLPTSKRAREPSAQPARPTSKDDNIGDTIEVKIVETEKQTDRPNIPSNLVKTAAPASRSLSKTSGKQASPVRPKTPHTIGSKPKQHRFGTQTPGTASKGGTVKKPSTLPRPARPASRLTSKKDQGTVRRPRAGVDAGISAAKPVPCPRWQTHGCRESFATVGGAVSHMTVHDDQAPFWCPRMEDRDCFQPFDSKEAAQDHAEVHKRDKLQKCNYAAGRDYTDCRQEFATARERNVHEMQHEALTYQCPLCIDPIQVYADQNSMLRHLRTRHMNNPAQPDMASQARIVEKIQPLTQNEMARYRVQKHGVLGDKIYDADHVRFALLYGFESLLEEEDEETRGRTSRRSRRASEKGEQGSTSKASEKGSKGKKGGNAEDPMEID